MNKIIITFGIQNVHQHTSLKSVELLIMCSCIPLRYLCFEVHILCSFAKSFKLDLSILSHETRVIGLYGA